MKIIMREKKMSILCSGTNGHREEIVYRAYSKDQLHPGDIRP